jgi:death-on-curing protein
MVDGSILYLTVEEVMHIHARAMESMGWNEAPLRSEGELASAVARPQHAAYYGGADIAYQAVTLAVGISQNQPFVDGNKRTAMATMRVFLQLNGYAINADPLPIALHIEAVADRLGSLDEAIDEFASWLRERLKRIDATR